MSLFVKIKWVFGLSLVLLLILGTSRINVNNFKEVQTSIETIYEDRLVVKGHVLKLSALLHDKELANAKEDASFYREKNAAVNGQIDESIRAFRATNLTSLEKRTLDRFDSDIGLLKVAEAEMKLEESAEFTPAVTQRLAGHFKSLKDDIELLSRIQLEEGKRHMMLGRKAISAMDVTSTIETYIMAFIALCILAAIIYTPKNEDA